jgi:hypothetical protein
MRERRTIPADNWLALKLRTRGDAHESKLASSGG